MRLQLLVLEYHFCGGGIGSRKCVTLATVTLSFIKVIVMQRSLQRKVVSMVLPITDLAGHLLVIVNLFQLVFDILEDLLVCSACWAAFCSSLCHGVSMGRCLSLRNVT
jgi:hypothetical protein